MFQRWLWIVVRSLQLNPYLTPREKQIARLLVDGCENAEIAKVLGMATRTVKHHFGRIFPKFGITQGVKRVKLAVLFYRNPGLWNDSPTHSGGNVS